MNRDLKQSFIKKGLTLSHVLISLANIRHTNPLQCSDCKILVWGFLHDRLRAYKRLCDVNAA